MLRILAVGVELALDEALVHRVEPEEAVDHLSREVWVALALGPGDHEELLREVRARPELAHMALLRGEDLAGQARTACEDYRLRYGDGELGPEQMAILARLWAETRPLHLEQARRLLEGWGPGALVEAHQLAGALGTFGLVEEARLARELEERLRAGAPRPPEAEELVRRLSAQVQDPGLRDQ